MRPLQIQTPLFSILSLPAEEQIIVKLFAKLNMLVNVLRVNFEKQNSDSFSEQS